jgi:hypothetical protein
MKINELEQSIASYGLGGGLITLSLSDMAAKAQQIAIILGCLVVAVRLIHDVIALYRKIKNTEL